MNGGEAAPLKFKILGLAEQSQREREDGEVREVREGRRRNVRKSVQGKGQSERTVGCSEENKTRNGRRRHPPDRPPRSVPPPDALSVPLRRPPPLRRARGLLPQVQQSQPRLRFRPRHRQQQQQQQVQSLSRV